jgi:protein-S-isoprenylcysteine O-methyltransferase Ste14
MSQISTGFSVLSLFALVLNSFIYYKFNQRSLATNRNASRKNLDSALDFKIFYQILRVVFPGLVVLSLTSIQKTALFVEVSNGVIAGAMALLITSQAFFYWSISALGKNYSPCYESYLPTTVVRTGPYRITRHPIYTANTLSLFAISVGIGSWICFGLAVLFLYFCYRSAFKEEQQLSCGLPGYEDYKRATPRLIIF